MDELQRLTDEARALLDHTFADHLAPAAKEVFAGEAKRALADIDRKLDGWLSDAFYKIQEIRDIASKLSGVADDGRAQQDLVARSAQSAEEALAKARQEWHAVSTMVPGVNKTLLESAQALSALKSLLEATNRAVTEVPTLAASQALHAVQPLLNTQAQQLARVDMRVGGLAEQIEERWGARYRFLRSIVVIQMVLLGGCLAAALVRLL